MNERRTLDELLREYEPERQSQLDREDAEMADPKYQTRLAEKRAAEFQLGVRQGWWDVEGNPIARQPPDEDEDD